MGSFGYPVEEIRERCDLVEIVSGYVALKKSGRTLKGLCPFHNEKTPSFHVNPERQVWKCFGCGEGGDVFSFVQKIDNMTFPEAVEMLARKAGVEIHRTEGLAKQLSERDRLLRANSVACAFFRAQLRKSAKAQDYLNKRGLGEQTVEKYRLGYAPDSWDGLSDYLMANSVSTGDAAKAGLVVARENGQGFYDRFRDRLIFPIIDNSDRAIAFGGRALGDDPAKYLNSPETPLFVKNRTLYGLNFARRVIGSQDRALVVEGYMDAITAQEAGFENTVATMGTALTEEHVNVLARFTKSAVLAFDSDSAGMAAALRSGPIFERLGFSVRILSMPKGEDPDSILRGGDSHRFAGLIEQAAPLADYRVNLALAEHDLNTDEGKTAALRSAAAVLADVESPVERERLIRSLAKYHPTFNTGTTLAEDHLRSEVSRSRYRAAGRKPAGTVAAKASEDGNGAKTRPSLVEQSERLLLGIIILRGADAGKVFEALPPKEFIAGGAAELAEAVSRQFTELGKIDQEKLRTDVANTLAEGLLTDILVGLDESGLNDAADEVIERIVSRKKLEQRIRLRALAQKLQEGAIKKGDEEYEEYWRLASEDPGPWRR